MKKITRNEASHLLREFGVLETKIERSKDAMIVHSSLANNHSLLIKYDMKKHHKSYFIEN